MKTAFFHGNGEIRVEDVERPRPGPGEVLIAIRAAGICGSDLHRYRGLDPWGTGGPLEADEQPRRAGHEIAGTVAELGAGVDPRITGLAIGQPVAVEPLQLAGCGRCAACARGDDHLCPRRGLQDGQRRKSAGFSEFDVAPLGQVFPVSGGLPLEIAALADVYACAVHALRRAPIAPPHTVLVIGTGPVGLALGQAARLAGARRVLLVGRRSAALERALRAGAADRVILASPGASLGDLVRDANDGRGADVAFEAVGGEAVGGGENLLHEILDALDFGGVLGVLGAWTGNVSLPYRAANDKEIDLRFSNGYSSWEGRREFAIALGWLENHRVDATALITHRFPLEEIAEAFRVADRKAETGAVKVMLEP